MAVLAFLKQQLLVLSTIAACPSHLLLPMTLSAAHRVSRGIYCPHRAIPALRPYARQPVSLAASKFPGSPHFFLPAHIPRSHLLFPSRGGR
jgi:hypothetical protein